MVYADNDYFGEIVDGKMILNDYGKIAEKFWYEIPMHYMKSKIDYFIIMPNHIHGIIIIENEIYSPHYHAVGNENYYSVNTVGNENFCSLHNNPQHKTILSNIIKGFKIGCTKEIKYNHNYFLGCYN
ncbi:MAG: hypothetical protein V3575_02725 [Candidatus Absconditabacteria bacterium]